MNTARGKAWGGKGKVKVKSERDVGIGGSGSAAFPLTLTLLLAIAGCGGIGRFDVIITLEREGFRRIEKTVPSIQVDLVGINDAEYRQASSMGLNEFWAVDSPVRMTWERKGYAHVKTFGEEQPTRQVLYRRHHVWNDWEAKGSRFLFVLVNYPRGKVDDKEGDADVRRKILPLERRRWKNYFWGKRVIWIEVTPSGLIVHTPPKPE